MTKDDEPETEGAASGAEEAADQEADDDSFTTTSDVRHLPRIDEPREATSKASLGWALAVTVVVSAIFHFAFAPELVAKGVPLIALGAAYAVFAAVGALRLRASKNLATLRPKAGDISIGALVAGLLYGLGYAGVKLVMARGTPREGWIVNLYKMLGDPTVPSHLMVSIPVFFIGGLEEITWRGLVLESLETHLGTFRASVLTAVLWAAAHAPTLYRLGDPLSGYNPLLVAGALGCGLVWAYLRFRVGRLSTVVISHAIFSWAIIQFPLWKPA
jgi:membrane protease YdiL (CAAX protease family)